MGKISELPINERYASKLDNQTIANPFELANALKKNKYIDY